MGLACSTISIEGHALQRMFERNIPLGDVLETVRNGEVIKTYADDKPYPSFLLLNFINRKPLHVVAAQNAVRNVCFVITVYEPAPNLWLPDFKNKIT